MSEALAEYQRLLETLPGGIGGSVELLLGQLPDDAAHCLRLAAVPHHFDCDLLGLMEPALSADRLKSACDELSTLSIVAQAGEELFVHDTAREYLFEHYWLQPQQQESFVALSARLVDHFTAKENESPADTEGRSVAQRQRMFHLIGADQGAGFSAFEQLCRQERYGFRLHSCQTLIALVHEYDAALAPERKLWLAYHEAKLLLDLRRLTEAETLLEDLLSAEPADNGLRARSLFRLASVYCAQRRFPEARSKFNEALDFVRACADTREQEIRLMQGLATVHIELDEPEEAAEILRRTISMAEATDDSPALAASYNSLGILHRKRGQMARAVEAFNKSLEYLGEGQERVRRSQLYNNLGLIYADQADWDAARDSLEKSLEIAQKAGHTNSQAVARSNLGRVYLCLGRPDDAVRSAEEAIALFRQIHNWFGAAATMQGLGRFYRREGKFEKARENLASAAELFNRVEALERARECEAEIKRIGRRRGLRWFGKVVLIVLAMIFALFIVFAFIGFLLD